MEVNGVARSRRSSPLIHTHKVTGPEEKSSETQQHSATRPDSVLLSWDQILPWQQDNRFIISHYRPASFSYLRSLKSLGWLHNQSVNIYTHLLGAVFFVASALWFHRELAVRYQSASRTDVFVFDCFFLGSTLCLAFSASFHTLTNHSAEVARSWLLFDMIGIVCLTTSSFFPGVYYGFYCEPEVIRTYWSMIVLLGGGCAAVVAIPRFQTIQWKHFRTAMFVAVGLSGVLPMSHAVRLFGIPQANLQMGWSYFVMEAVCYISGAIFYATKLPERWWPGRFDVWGNSHQYFHILVVLGALAHFAGITTAFHYNHDPSTRRC
ncbi:hypothetical protein XPA_005405 [Xanthoria parietina]